eukprot:1794922-Pyramimonas_sp.AAC.1
MKCRRRGFRMNPEAARSSSRAARPGHVEHVNEGGERLLARGHLQCHRLSAIKAAGSKHGPQAARRLTDSWRWAYFQGCNMAIV